MSEQFAELGGGLTLCYETFGSPDDPAILLIMGLGAQMVAWRDDFCTQLAGRGFHVIRFDNRDSGRSTRMKGRPPSILELTTRRPRNLTYTLSEMADDAAGLLDHLGIERAHVVGASMGGMIAQLVACRYPARVLSLVSIMSSTGDRFTGQPALAVIPMFLGRPGQGREAYVERALKLFRAVGSPEYFDEESVREVSELMWDRGVTLSGTGRQLGAVVADRSRAKRLRRITAPTLVIHGKADKLVRPSGGKATAKAIPGARLMMIEGMGHDLPRALWPRFIDAIVENTARADSDTMATSSPNPQAGV
jgi:pimeloyl-ACP methyl ester carboxylesterase